jgi:hypothetical protein
MPQPALWPVSPLTKRRLKGLCRGDAAVLMEWIAETGWRGVLTCCLVIVLGTGLYGFTVGLWRAPEQALSTAVKVPLLILLTCGGNAILNGLLAILLGTGLSFRQSSLAILMSFTLIAVILGAFAPVCLFLLYNTPPMNQAAQLTGHSLMLLSHVLLISYAGVLANARLYDLLAQLTHDRQVAARVLFAWLAGNLLLGSQVSWVLRPFIGSPGLPVQFLRDEPFRGSFFEAVWFSLRNLLFGPS